MRLLFTLAWLAASAFGAQDTLPENVTTKEYLFAARTLSDFRKELDDAKDKSLKKQLASGSGVAGIYVKVKLVDKRIVEVELHYSTIVSPTLEPLRETPFRPSDEDFENLVNAIPGFG